MSWRRPYPIDTFNGVGVLILGLAGLPAVGVAIGLVLGWHEWRAGYALFVPVLAYGARAYLYGLFVSDRGVRIRWLWSTRTLPWAAISRFDSKPAYRGQSPHGWQTIWVIPHQGPAIKTPLTRMTRWDLSFYPRPLAGLLEPAYNKALQTLREHLLRATR